MSRSKSGDLICEAAIQLASKYQVAHDFFSPKEDRHVISENLIHVWRGDLMQKILLQTRSDNENESGDRYTVGVILPALEKAEQFVFWTRDDGEFLACAARALLDLHEFCERQAIAAYSGKSSRQWRVVVSPDAMRIKPQRRAGASSVEVLPFVTLVQFRPFCVP